MSRRRFSSSEKKKFGRKRHGVVMLNLVLFLGELLLTRNLGMIGPRFLVFVFCPFWISFHKESTLVM